MKMRLLFFVIFVIFFISCDKADTQIKIDWNDLKIGIINRDKFLIDNELSKLLTNTNPKPTDDDKIGQSDNINKLINTMNTSSVITSELICYACIKTYPAQSEIKIFTDSSGIKITRIIDLKTPNDDRLRFVNIHDNK
jgi:hypothetical protein